MSGIDETDIYAKADAIANELLSALLEDYKDDQGFDVSVKQR
jgi:hypothetical protein